jgi:hypothetical protein
MMSYVVVALESVAVSASIGPRGRSGDVIG